MKRFEVLGVVGEGAYGVVLKCKNKKSREISDFFLRNSDGHNCLSFWVSRNIYTSRYVDFRRVFHISDDLRGTPSRWLLYKVKNQTFL